MGWWIQFSKARMASITSSVFFLNLFIYLFLAVLCLHCYVSFSLVAVIGGCSSWGVWASHCGGFSCCRARASVVAAMGSRAQAQKLWCTGLVGPWHVGSSQIRDRTCVSCIGRRILYYWATREAQDSCFYLNGPLGKGEEVMRSEIMKEVSGLRHHPPSPVLQANQWLPGNAKFMWDGQLAQPRTLGIIYLLGGEASDPVKP